MVIISGSGKTVDEALPPQEAPFISGYTFQGDVVSLTVEGNVTFLTVKGEVVHLQIDNWEESNEQL